MRAVVAFITMLVCLVTATHAQEKRVSPQDSKILLLAPHLEDVSPIYQYFGWDDRASIETSYGGIPALIRRRPVPKSICTKPPR